jgi:hypothetical protein
MTRIPRRWFLAGPAAVASLPLGVSGALSIFGPARLYLGALSVALLAWTFRLRVPAIVRACSVTGLRPGGTGKPGAVLQP